MKVKIKYAVLAFVPFFLSSCFFGSDDDYHYVPRSVETVEISTAEAFLKMDEGYGAGEEKNYVLTNDIDFTGITSSLPCLHSSLDGNGHSLLNYSISSRNDQTVALIQENRGVIKNLKVKNFSVDVTAEGEDASLLVGRNYGSVADVEASDSSINAARSINVGGIVAASFNANISKCTNNSPITGGQNVGGVAGIFYISNSFNKDLDCINTASIVGDTSVGGIIGRLQTFYKTGNNYSLTGSLSFAENKGLISGKENVGGVIGFSKGTFVDGGLSVDTLFENYLSDFKNEGNVGGTSYVGGIVGKSEWTREINNCENKGNIAGKEHVGGIAGGTTSSLKCAKDTNTGSIKGESYLGGIAGNASIITESSSECEFTIDGTINSYIGGIAGSLIYTSYCTNKSNITFPETNTVNKVGGIAGYARVGGDTKVTDNINEGDIIAPLKDSDEIGGIYGLCSSYTDTEIMHNENKGIVKGGGHVGGFAGQLIAERNDSSVKDGDFVDFHDNTNSANIEGGFTCVGGLLGRATGGTYSIGMQSFVMNVKIRHNTNSGNITFGSQIAESDKASYLDKNYGAAIVGMIYVRTTFEANTNTNTGTVYSYISNSNIEVLYN